MKKILLTTLLITPAFLFAAPHLPYQVYGTVSGATSGTISAVIDGEVVATTSIEEDGTFGKNTFFFIPDLHGDASGKTVSFKLNSAGADESLTFVSGGLTNTTLTLSVISGGGTSLPNSFVTSTVTAPASTAPQDFNGDGVVDVQDFNFLISNWGNAAADLNGDGVTDVIDFTILMANWS